MQHSTLFDQNVVGCRVHCSRRDREASMHYKTQKNINL